MNLLSKFKGRFAAALLLCSLAGLAFVASTCAVAAEVDATNQELEGFFRDLLIKLDDVPATVAMAPSRMLEIITQEQVLPALDDSERQAMLPLLSNAARRDLVSRRQAGDWSKPAVLATYKSSKPNEVHAVVRWQSQRGEGSESLSFLLFKDAHEGWQIVDWRGANSTVGVAVQKGVLLAALHGNFGPQEALHRLQAAHAAVAMGDDLGAARILRTPLEERAPPSLRAAHSLLMADIFLRQQLPNPTNECLDKVERLNPSLSLLWQLKASNCLLQNQYIEAEQHARKALALGGADAETLTTLGRALRKRKQTEPALVAFSQALQCDRNHLVALLELAQTLPDDRKRELKQHFLNLRDPLGELDRVAEALLAAGDGKAVEVIVAALADVAPAAQTSSTYLAEAKLLNKDYESAAQHFATALKRDDPDDEGHLARRYALAMVLANKGPDAYPLLARQTSADAALILLAELLLDRKESTSLQALLKQAPATSAPYVALIRGEQALQAEDFAAAAAHFSAACETQSEDALQLPRAREGLVLALHRQGKSLAAYDQSPAKPVAFDQLARLLGAAKDSKTLEQLIARHRDSHPDDATLPMWDAELLWLAQDYKRCAEQLEKHPEFLDSPDYQARYEDRLIRSLIRSEQLDAALDLASQSTLRDQDPWFEMVVHGAAGNVRATEQLLPRCIGHGYNLSDVYADPDLSLALKKAPFSEFCERYPAPLPEPKK